MYMYAWYEMLGLMILAGAFVFAFCRGVDLLLESWLDRRHEKRQERLDRG